MKNEPFVIERIFNTSPAIIWKAISNREKMKEWYFDLAAFEPVPGFEFEFFGGPPERSYRHLCRVLEVIPNKKLSYSWRYDGYEGNSVVTWEIIPQGDTTMLRLTHEGLETFPASNRDFAKQNFAMGWTQIIGSSLPGWLEKHN